MDADRRIARRLVIETLHQVSRRLRAAESVEEWAATLRQAASGDCGRCGVFFLEDGILRGEGIASTALSDAPAFQSALETADTMITLHSPRELSAAVAAAFPAPPEVRAYLFPILTNGRVRAVLYAQPGEEPLDMSALELLAMLAGPAFPKGAAVSLDLAKPGTPGASLVSIAPLQQGGGKPDAQELTGRDWALLTRDEQDLHIRAQRFARVRVAEIRLYQAEAVKTGREQRDLYQALRSQIEMGREDFQRQFMEGNPTMVDYFHQELVRTLANHDAEMLGAEYPGPLR